MKKNSVLRFLASCLKKPNNSPVSMQQDPGVFLQIDGAEQQHRCTLRSVANGEIHLYAQSYFRTGLRVTISFGLVEIPGVVLYSSRKESAFLVCVTTIAETRGEPRFPINRAGRLIVLTDRETVFAPCTILDLSRSGMGIQAPCNVAVGQMAYLETEGALVIGEVRSCVSSGRADAYRIGLQITDVVTGRRPRGSPAHSITELVSRMVRKGDKSQPIL